MRNGLIVCSFLEARLSILIKNHCLSLLLWGFGDPRALWWVCRTTLYKYIFPMDQMPHENKGSRQSSCSTKFCEVCILQIPSIYTGADINANNLPHVDCFYYISNRDKRLVNCKDHSWCVSWWGVTANKVNINQLTILCSDDRKVG